MLINTVGNTSEFSFISVRPGMSVEIACGSDDSQISFWFSRGPIVQGGLSEIETMPYVSLPKRRLQVQCEDLNFPPEIEQNVAQVMQCLQEFYGWPEKECIEAFRWSFMSGSGAAMKLLRTAQEMRDFQETK